MPTLDHVRPLFALLLALPACPSGGGGGSEETGTTAATTTSEPGTTTGPTEPGTTTGETTVDPTGETTVDPTTGGEPVDDPPGEALESTKMRDLSPDPTEEEIATMADDELAFAVDLFKALPSDPGNLAISPTSLRFAFAQIYEGARNATETEIADVLHFSLAKPRLHNAFNALDLTLEARDLPAEADAEGDNSLTLDLYNQMFGRPDINWSQDFLDVLAESYGSQLHLLDFADDPEAKRLLINDWVFDVTRERIVELLPPGSIFPEVTAVLVNALYLKAPWEAPFEYVDEQGTFIRDDGSEVVTAMMAGMFGGTRRYAAPGVQAAELPLRGGALKLVLVVPDAGTFDAFTAGMSAAGLREIFDGFEYADLEVRMPRFSFSSDFALKDPLKGLGMATAFELGGADFSGLGGDMAISDVYHQVFVAVDEKGVEAAAASAIVTFDSGSPEFEVLIADRPFYFAIRDVEADATLFLGRVIDPTLPP